MGKQSGTQTNTIREQRGPYAPAIPGLQLGLDELQRIYYGGAGAPPTAPNRQDFYNSPVSVGPGGKVRAAGQPSSYTPNSFGLNPGGGMQQQAPQFNQGGYDQALARYNASRAAWQQQRDAGSGAQNPVNDYGLANVGAEQLRRTLSGEMLNSNPYIDSIVADMGADVNSLFSGGSRYGSGAHQDALARASAALRFGNYEAERGRQMQAFGMAPQYDLAPYQLYSAQQSAPYEQIRQMLGLQLPIANVGGDSSQLSSSPIYSNPLLGGVSGAAAGAGLGLALKEAGALSSFGPWGWALTGLGGLAGLLGS